MDVKQSNPDRFWDKKILSDGAVGLNWQNMLFCHVKSFQWGHYLKNIKCNN